MPSDFDVGFLIGLLIGEGSFGGDGRQPQVTLRMHVRHEALFLWIESTFPGGKLYGPYNHGGRRYFQWMARGPYLRDVLLPILERTLSPDLDAHSFERFEQMKHRYPGRLAPSTHDRPEPRARPAAPRRSPPEPASTAGAPPAPSGPVTAIFERLRQASRPEPAR
jgi:hypothetical protein